MLPSVLYSVFWLETLSHLVVALLCSLSKAKEEQLGLTGTQLTLSTLQAVASSWSQRFFETRAISQSDHTPACHLAASPFHILSLSVLHREIYPL